MISGSRGISWMTFAGFSPGTQIRNKRRGLEAD
jgi:hypothetical protein